MRYAKCTKRLFEQDTFLVVKQGWKSKINNSSAMEFKLSRKAGPSAFQLKGDNVEK